MIDEGKVLAAATPGYGGIAEALFKMCVGNHVGLRLSRQRQRGRPLQALLRRSHPGTAGCFRRVSSWALPPWITLWSLAARLPIWLPCRKSEEAKLEPVFPYRKARQQSRRPGI